MGPSTRIMAALLSAVLFVTNCLLPHSAEANLWKERNASRRAATVTGPPGPVMLASLPLPARLASPRPSRLAPALPAPRRSLPGLPQTLGFNASDLPLAYGSVRPVSLPSSPPTHLVIHVQDIHANPEAQRNIRSAIAQLIESKAVDLVALEAAFGPVSIDGFRNYHRREALEKVTAHLFRENRMPGSVQAALLSKTAPPPLVGVDSEAAYGANVRAYREASARVDAEEKILNANEQALEREKEAVLNPDLLRLQAIVEDHREGRISFGEYVERLVPSSPGSEPYPMIARFLQALAMETALDFRAVEDQRARLLEELTASMPVAETEALLAWATAFRSGRVSSMEFYDHIASLCRRASVDLNLYPAMKTYLRYVLITDSIDGETLINEADRLERRALAAATRTPLEEQWIARSRRLFLERKLLDFALTPAEWTDYKRTGRGGPGHAPFERFYEQAEIRDAAMAGNLIATLKANGGKRAVLVAGGFHASGVAAHLRQAGVAVVSFVPRLTKAETGQGTAYLSVFNREQTPLEKLFAGAPLFLATPVLTPTDRLEQSVLMVSEAAVAGEVVDAQQDLDSILGPSQARIELDVDGRQAVGRVRHALEHHFTRFFFEIRSDGSLNVRFDRVALTALAAVQMSILLAALSTLRGPMGAVPLVFATAVLCLVAMLILADDFLSPGTGFIPELAVSEGPRVVRRPLRDWILMMASGQIPEPPAPLPGDTPIESEDVVIPGPRGNLIKRALLSDPTIVTIDDLANKTARQLRSLIYSGTKRLGSKSIDAIRAFLQSVGRTLATMQRLTSSPRRRTPAIELTGQNRQLAILRLAYVRLTSANIRLIELTSLRRGPVDEEELNNDYTALIDEIVNLRDTVLAPAVREGNRQSRAEVLEQLNRGVELMQARRSVNANLVFVSAANKLLAEYVQLFGRKLDRARSYRQVRGKFWYDQKNRQYILLQGSWAMHQIAEDSIQLKRINGHRYQILWEAFRSVDHQVDREIDDLFAVESVLRDLREAQRTLNNLRRPRGRQAAASPDADLHARLDELFARVDGDLDSTWIVEKELAQQSARCARVQSQLEDWGPAHTTVSLAITLLEKRAEEIRAIITYVERARLRPMRDFIDKRNRMLMHDVGSLLVGFERVYRTLVKTSDPIIVRQQVADFRATARRLKEKFDRGREPEFLGLSGYTERALDAFNRMVQALDRGDLDAAKRNRIAVQRALELAEDKVKTAEWISAFMQKYRERFKAMRLAGVPREEAMERCFRETYQETLSLFNLRPDTGKDIWWWYKMYQTVFVRLRVDLRADRNAEGPANADRRQPNPRFDAFSTFTDILAINVQRPRDGESSYNALAETLRHPWLVSAIITPQTYQLIESRAGTSQNLFSWSNSDKAALPQAIENDMPDLPRTRVVEPSERLRAAAEMRNRHLKGQPAPAGAPLGLTDGTLSLFGGNRALARRWAFLVEEGRFSGVLLNSTWLLWFFKDAAPWAPSAILATQILIYGVSSLWFGFSHRRLQSSTAEPDDDTPAPLATTRHKLLFSLLGAIFRAGYLGAFFLPWYWSVAALGFALASHFVYNAYVAPALKWWLASIAEGELTPEERVDHVLSKIFADVNGPLKTITPEEKRTMYDRPERSVITPILQGRSIPLRRSQVNQVVNALKKLKDETSGRPAAPIQPSPADIQFAALVAEAISGDVRSFPDMAASLDALVGELPSEAGLEWIDLLERMHEIASATLKNRGSFDKAKLDALLWMNTVWFVPRGLFVYPASGPGLDGKEWVVGRILASHPPIATEDKNVPVYEVRDVPGRDDLRTGSMLFRNAVVLVFPDRPTRDIKGVLKPKLDVAKNAQFLKFPRHLNDRFGGKLREIFLKHGVIQEAYDLHRLALLRPYAKDELDDPSSIREQVRLFFDHRLSADGFLRKLVQRSRNYEDPSRGVGPDHTTVAAGTVLEALARSAVGDAPEMIAASAGSELGRYQSLPSLMNAPGVITLILIANELHNAGIDVPAGFHHLNQIQWTSGIGGLPTESDLSAFIGQLPEIAPSAIRAACRRIYDRESATPLSDFHPPEWAIAADADRTPAHELIDQAISTVFSKPVAARLASEIQGGEKQKIFDDPKERTIQSVLKAHGVTPKKGQIGQLAGIIERLKRQSRPDAPRAGEAVRGTPEDMRFARKVMDVLKPASESQAATLVSLSDLGKVLPPEEQQKWIATLEEIRKSLSQSTANGRSRELTFLDALMILNERWFAPRFLYVYPMDELNLQSDFLLGRIVQKHPAFVVGGRHVPVYEIEDLDSRDAPKNNGMDLHRSVILLFPDRGMGDFDSVLKGKKGTVSDEYAAYIRALKRIHGDEIRRRFLERSFLMEAYNIYVEHLVQGGSEVDLRENRHLQTRVELGLELRLSKDGMLRQIIEKPSVLKPAMHNHAALFVGVPNVLAHFALGACGRGPELIGTTAGSEIGRARSLGRLTSAPSLMALILLANRLSEAGVDVPAGFRDLNSIDWTGPIKPAILSDALTFISRLPAINPAVLRLAFLDLYNRESATPLHEFKPSEWAVDDDARARGENTDANSIANDIREVLIPAKDALIDTLAPPSIQSFTSVGVSGHASADAMVAAGTLSSMLGTLEAWHNTGFSNRVVLEQVGLVDEDLAQWRNVVIPSLETIVADGVAAQHHSLLILDQCIHRLNSVWFVPRNLIFFQSDSIELSDGTATSYTVSDIVAVHAVSIGDASASIYVVRTDEEALDPLNLEWQSPLRQVHGSLVIGEGQTRLSHAEKMRIVENIRNARETASDPLQVALVQVIQTLENRSERDVAFHAVEHSALAALANARDNLHVTRMGKDRYPDESTAFARMLSSRVLHPKGHLGAIATALLNRPEQAAQQASFVHAAQHASGELAAAAEGQDPLAAVMEWLSAVAMGDKNAYGTRSYIALLLLLVHLRPSYEASFEKGSLALPVISRDDWARFGAELATLAPEKLRKAMVAVHEKEFKTSALALDPAAGDTVRAMMTSILADAPIAASDGAPSSPPTPAGRPARNGNNVPAGRSVVAPPVPTDSDFHAELLDALEALFKSGMTNFRDLAELMYTRLKGRDQDHWDLLVNKLTSEAEQMQGHRDVGEIYQAVVHGLNLFWMIPHKRLLLSSDSYTYREPSSQLEFLSLFKIERSLIGAEIADAPFLAFSIVPVSGGPKTPMAHLWNPNGLVLLDESMVRNQIANMERSLVSRKREGTPLAPINELLHDLYGQVRKRGNVESRLELSEYLLHQTLCAASAHAWIEEKASRRFNRSGDFDAYLQAFSEWAFNPNGHLARHRTRLDSTAALERDGLNELRTFSVQLGAGVRGTHPKTAILSWASGLDDWGKQTLTPTGNGAIGLYLMGHHFSQATNAEQAVEALSPVTEPMTLETLTALSPRQWAELGRFLAERSDDELKDAMRAVYADEFALPLPEAELVREGGHWSIRPHSAQDKGFAGPVGSDSVPASDPTIHGGSISVDWGPPHLIQEAMRSELAIYVGALGVANRIEFVAAGKKAKQDIRLELRPGHVLRIELTGRFIARIMNQHSDPKARTVALVAAIEKQLGSLRAQLWRPVVPSVSAAIHQLYQSGFKDFQALEDVASSLPSVEGWRWKELIEELKAAADAPEFGRAPDDIWNRMMGFVSLFFARRNLALTENDHKQFHPPGVTAPSLNVFPIQSSVEMRVEGLFQEYVVFARGAGSAAGPSLVNPVFRTLGFSVMDPAVAEARLQRLRDFVKTHKNPSARQGSDRDLTDAIAALERNLSSVDFSADADLKHSAIMGVWQAKIFSAVFDRLSSDAKGPVSAEEFGAVMLTGSLKTLLAEANHFAAVRNHLQELGAMLASGALGPSPWGPFVDWFTPSEALDVINMRGDGQIAVLLLGRELGFYDGEITVQSLTAPLMAGSAPLDVLQKLVQVPEERLRAAMRRVYENEFVLPLGNVTQVPAAISSLVGTAAADETPRVSATPKKGADKPKKEKRPEIEDVSPASDPSTRDERLLADIQAIEAQFPDSDDDFQILFIEENGGVALLMARGAGVSEAAILQWLEARPIRSGYAEILRRNPKPEVLVAVIKAMSGDWVRLAVAFDTTIENIQAMIASAGLEEARQQAWSRRERTAAEALAELDEAFPTDELKTEFVVVCGGRLSEMSALSGAAPATLRLWFRTHAHLELAERASTERLVYPGDGRMRDLITRHGALPHFIAQEMETDVATVALWLNANDEIQTYAEEVAAANAAAFPGGELIADLINLFSGIVARMADECRVAIVTMNAWLAQAGLERDAQRKRAEFPGEDTVRALVAAHSGSIKAMADAREVSSAVINRWISRVPGLVAEARDLRKRDPGKERLSALVLDHMGNREEIARICRVAPSTVEMWLKKHGLKSMADELRERDQVQRLLDDKDLMAAVSLLQDDPDRLFVYVSIFYPDLTPMEIKQVTRLSLQALSGHRYESFEGFAETLSTPELFFQGQSVTDDVTLSTNEDTVTVQGRAPPGVRSIAVRGAYNKRIPVDEDGFFSASLPLPRRNNAANVFRFFAIDESSPDDPRRSAPVTLTVHQTGESLSHREALNQLISLERLREKRISKTFSDEYLQRTKERCLLGDFTYDEEAGFAKLEQRIDAADGLERDMLIRIREKFLTIRDMTFPYISDGEDGRPRAPYFYQKWSVYEMEQLETFEGAHGGVLSLEPGMGKTLIAMLYMWRKTDGFGLGDRAVVIVPPSLLPSWEEEESKWMTEPRMTSFRGAHADRDRELEHLAERESDEDRPLERPIYLSNIDFFATRMTKERRRRLGNVRYLFIDEAHFNVNAATKRSRGARLLGMNRENPPINWLVTGTPVITPSEIPGMLEMVVANPRRATSKRSRRHVGPVTTRELIDSFLLLNNHTVRLRMDDVFDRYDAEKPAAQPHTIPIREDVLEDYEYAPEQMEGMREVFTDYGVISPGWLERLYKLIHIQNNPNPTPAMPVSPKLDKAVQVVDRELASLRDQGKVGKILIAVRHHEDAEALADRLGWGTAEDRGVALYYDGAYLAAHQDSKGQLIDANGNLRRFRLVSGRYVETNDPDDMPLKAADYQRNIFLNDATKHVLILTYSKGAYGLNLPSDVVIPYDLPDTIREYEQMVARAIRINTRRDVVRVIQLVGRYSPAGLSAYPALLVEAFFRHSYESIQRMNLQEQKRFVDFLVDLSLDDENALESWSRNFLQIMMPQLFSGTAADAIEPASDDDQGAPEEDVDTADEETEAGSEAAVPSAPEDGAVEETDPNQATEQEEKEISEAVGHAIRSARAFADATESTMQFSKGNAFEQLVGLYLSVAHGPDVVPQPRLNIKTSHSDHIRTDFWISPEHLVEVKVRPIKTEIKRAAYTNLRAIDERKNGVHDREQPHMNVVSRKTRVEILLAEEPSGFRAWFEKKLLPKLGGDGRVSYRTLADRISADRANGGDDALVSRFGDLVLTVQRQILNLEKHHELSFTERRSIYDSWERFLHNLTLEKKGGGKLTLEEKIFALEYALSYFGIEDGTAAAPRVLPISVIQDLGLPGTDVARNRYSFQDDDGEVRSERNWDPESWMKRRLVDEYNHLFGDTKDHYDDDVDEWTQMYAFELGKTMEDFKVFLRKIDQRIRGANEIRKRTRQQQRLEAELSTDIDSLPAAYQDRYKKLLEGLALTTWLTRPIARWAERHRISGTSLLFVIGALVVLEELIYAEALLRFLPWVLATYGHLDPALSPLVSVGLFLTGSLLFGWSHRDLFALSSDGRLEAYGQSTVGHKLAFAGLGALFRLGYFFPILFPDAATTGSLAAAISLHLIFDLSVAPALARARERASVHAVRRQGESYGRVTAEAWKRILPGSGLDEEVRKYGEAERLRSLSPGAFESLLNRIRSDRAAAPAEWPAMDQRDWESALYPLFTEASKEREMAALIGNKRLVLPVSRAEQDLIRTLVQALPAASPLYLLVDRADEQFFRALAARYDGRLVITVSRTAHGLVKDRSGRSLLNVGGLETLIHQALTENHLTAADVVLGLPASLSVDQRSGAISRDSILNRLQVAYFIGQTAVPVAVMDWLNLHTLVRLLASQA